MASKRGRLLSAALAGCVLASCAPTAPLVVSAIQRELSMELFDSARIRTIPVMLYGASRGRPRPLSVILPGYGVGQDEYGFIARDLAARGYVVAAIQIQLASDPPVPGGDNLAVSRRPYWQRGVDDVRFVASRLRSMRIAAAEPLVLVGHSHGGDTAMLFATVHPAEVRLAFSLDNRRMPLPRSARPRICSARSSDQAPDPGVLPSDGEIASLEMQIARLDAIRHDEMLDSATDAQKRAILAALDRCLTSHRSDKAAGASQ